MRIIAVDDEKLALTTLEQAILDAEPSAEIAGFVSGNAALEYAKENRVDIAFIDIQMPEINGLFLAVKLKEVYPKTNIVFVTGYSQYALDAMKLHPSGYVMKPATKESIEQEIENLRHPVPSEEPKKRVRVQTFGNFEVFLDDEPIAFERSSAKELFAYLINRQGTSVTTAEIAAVLFEDRAYDRALQNYTQKIISSMMKTLRKNSIDDIIFKSRNQISVDKTKIDCDYFDLINHDIKAVNAYLGEYMSNYTWAEITTGTLNETRL